MPRSPSTEAAGNRLTRAGIAAFLDALAETGMVCEAAARAGAPRASLYRRRAADPAFAAAWAAALEAGLDRLRDEAVRRALHGDEQTVWHRGEAVGTARRYSDALLMFLLRAHQPAVYREPRGGAEAAAHAAGKAARRAEDEQDRLVADAYALGKKHGVQALYDAIDGCSRGVPKRGGYADDDRAWGADDDPAGPDARGSDAGGADTRDAGDRAGADRPDAAPSRAGWPPGYAPAEPDGTPATTVGDARDPP